MSRATARLVHAAVVLVGATGIAYGWMLYLCVPDEESFAVVNHPMQPTVHNLHILVAPWLVFVCGMLWPTHVWERLCSRALPRRPTGILLAVGLLPMVLSGYLVQVTASETWRPVWVWVHGVTSCLWLLGYLVHQLSPRPDSSEREEAAGT